MAITIRQANKDDLPVIQHLASLIWPVAYVDILTPGQINYMLNAMYNLPVLQKQFQEGHEFLLAIKEDKPVGFAGFSPLEKPGYWKLHKLYVLPSQQSAGAGKALLSEVYRLISEQPGTHLELQVNRQNNARNFYKKQGFEIQCESDIAIGEGFFMNDYIMLKQIPKPVQS